jgi:hypothetical protein
MGKTAPLAGVRRGERPNACAGAQSQVPGYYFRRKLPADFSSRLLIVVKAR